MSSDNENEENKTEYGGRIPCGKHVYRVVILSRKDLKKHNPKGILSEEKWRGFIEQSDGWEHVGYGESNKFLIFRRNVEKDQELEVPVPEKLEIVKPFSAESVYKTLIEYEKKYHVFLDLEKSETINSKKLKTLFDWIFSLQKKLKISNKGIGLTFHLMDRLLSNNEVKIEGKTRQLYGSACLLIASRFQEHTCTPEESDMVYYSSNIFTSDELEKTQKDIFQHLGFSCVYPTIHHFIEILKTPECDANISLLNFLGKVALQECITHRYLSSTIAKACISLVSGKPSNTGNCQKNIYQACKCLLESKKYRTILDIFDKDRGKKFSLEELKICDEETEPIQHEITSCVSPKKNNEDYKLETILGHGTFGKVYSVSEGKRAFKKFKNALEYSTIRELSFVNELTHPNIVKLKEISIHDGSFGYSMKKLEKFSPLGLSVSDVIDYSRQLLKAVAYIHSRNVMHRDIKCPNILYNKQKKRLYLADFGSGCFFDTNEVFTHEDTVCTLWTRPPEVPSKRYNYSFDIWSVGCVIVEMITEESPFSVNSLTELWYAIAQYGNIEDLVSGGITGFLENNPVFALKSIEKILEKRRDVWKENEDKFKQVCLLLQRMLAPDLCFRITAEEALQHPFFEE